MPFTLNPFFTPDLNIYATKDDMSETVEKYAPKSDLPDLSPYAKSNEIPELHKPYAKSSEIPELLKPYAKSNELPDFEKYVKKEELNIYAEKSELPNLAPYVKTSDLAPYSKTDDVNEVLTQYVKKDHFQYVKSMLSCPQRNELPPKTYVRTSRETDFKKDGNNGIENNMTLDECVSIGKKKGWNFVVHRNSKHIHEHLKNTCFRYEGNVNNFWDKIRLDDWVKHSPGPASAHHTMVSLANRCIHSSFDPYSNGSERETAVSSMQEVPGAGNINICRDGECGRQ